MFRSQRSLLDQIESGALDRQTDLADLLRMCIALGGRAGSGDLRDWARRELDGYQANDPEIPAVRCVAAPLLLDGMHGTWQVERMQISTLDLPDGVQDVFDGGLPITFGVAELQKAALRTKVLDLAMPRTEDLVHIMNRSGRYTFTIHRIYFSVSPLVMVGVLDAIRTNLVALVAEIRAAGIDDQGNPSPGSADHAVNIVVKGRARATITTAIGSGASAASNHTEHLRADATEPRLPTWLSVPWTVAIAFAGLVASIAGVATWVGWIPFS